MLCACRIGSIGTCAYDALWTNPLFDCLAVPEEARAAFVLGVAGVTYPSIFVVFFVLPPPPLESRRGL